MKQLFAILVCLTGFATAAEPELFYELPEFCPTPDGFALAPWGDVLLACPNFADSTQPALILRITPENQVRIWTLWPTDPDTGKAGPMGMEFGPDGNLYVADNEGWGDGKTPGRLIRILVKDGKAVGSEVVARNLGHPNGVRVRDGFIYVSHSCIETGADGKLLSGIYRFLLDAKDVAVTNSVRDPHVFGVLKTENPNCQYGIDGICFDKSGNLYMGNFGDGTIFRVSFDANGQPSAPVLFVDSPKILSTDGMIMGTDGNIYLCDFTQNAIVKVAPNAEVTILAKNGDTDGADGSLDEPGDLIQRGDRLIISNFDNVPGPPHVNTGHDAPHTISILAL